MFGARKGVVLGCLAALLVCGGATAYAVAKTRTNKGAYKTALPSPFVSPKESGAMREVAEDRREAQGVPSAKEVTAINTTPGHYKTAAELDAEDRYIDRVAGAENHDPKGTLGQPASRRGDGGIALPIGGIAVERTERGGAEVASAEGQQSGNQAQQADAGQRQQQIPYADDFNGYGAYGPYGLYGGFPANTAGGVNGQNVASTAQAGNGVVQAQPPQQATSPGGAALGGPAPGAVGVQGTQQAPVQNQQPAQNPQAPVPYQTAPPVQPVPFQTAPPPAAQRGF